MKKSLAVGAVAVGIAVAGRRVSSRMESLDWEQVFARMPDNAPPKWMFRNISAIRENTDRILELLQRERAADAPVAKPAATT